jgi:chemotaxis protein MotB
MRQKKEKKENSERWLLTYSDLITLLMILFILLYAISNVSEEKYAVLSQSLGDSLGKGSSPISVGNGSILQNGGPISDTQDASGTDAEGTSDQTGTAAQQEEMEALKSSLSGIISKYDLLDDVGIVIHESELIITFSNKLFFDSGKAVLKESMKEGLDQIAIEINKIDNLIVIKGFTDNIPVNRGLFTSNWQLSAIRAANVVQYLIDEGKVDGERLTAVGCGEYQPIASNDTEEGRSQNRRIEFIILYNTESNTQE